MRQPPVVILRSTYHTALGPNNSAGSRLPILKKSDMVWPKRRSFPFHRLVASSNRCCLHLPSSSSPLLFFSSPPHHPQHYYPEHCLWISLARVFVIDSTKSVSIYMCYLGILEISLTDPLHFNQTSFTCPSPPPRHQPPPSSSCAFRQDETAVEPRSSANLGVRPTPPAHDAECVGGWDGRGIRDHHHHRARGARDCVRDTVRWREARSKAEASQESWPQEGQSRNQMSQFFIPNSCF